RQVMILRCRSGMLVMVAVSLPIKVILKQYIQWRGHLMANASPRQVMILRCTCGKGCRGEGGSLVEKRGPDGQAEQDVFSTHACFVALIFSCDEPDLRLHFVL